MRGEPPVAVFRLGHRPGRDDRMTSHVGLTARALGADRVVFGSDASAAAETVRSVTGRFGGPFDVETVESPVARLRAFDGAVAHLTMYGRPIQDAEVDVRSAHADGALGIVVGAEKVPFEVYELADFNVAVTNQPHSEIAGLAVFLDRLFEGRQLDREWTGADRRVVPQEAGKRTVELDDGVPVDGNDGDGADAHRSRDRG